MNWMMKWEEARAEQGETLSKEEYRAWQRKQAGEWKALSAARKAAEAADARAARLAEGEDLEPKPERRGRFLGTVIDKIGDSRTPFTTPAFESRIRKQCGLPADAPTPGFTRYSGSFRDKRCSDIFVPDSGAIGPDESFDYRMPRGLAHPGLCVASDSAILGVAKVLRECLSRGDRFLRP